MKCRDGSMLQFERALTTTVNNIEHIEATSYTGVGIVKVFFQPGTDIGIANAQVTAISQTVIRGMPPNITPPLILNYNAATVPIVQVALSAKGMTEQAVFDLAINTVRTPLVTVPGAAIPWPFGGKFRQIQIDLDPGAMQARGLSANDVANALCRPESADTGRHAEDRQRRVRHPAQQRAPELQGPGRPAGVRQGRCDRLSARRRPRTRRQPAAAEYRERRRQPLGRAAGIEERGCLDAGHHRRHQDQGRGDARDAARGSERRARQRPVAVREERHQRRRHRSRHRRDPDQPDDPAVPRARGGRPSSSPRRSRSPSWEPSPVLPPPARRSTS